VSKGVNTRMCRLSSATPCSRLGRWGCAVVRVRGWWFRAGGARPSSTPTILVLSALEAEGKGAGRGTV